MMCLCVSDCLRYADPREEMGLLVMLEKRILTTYSTEEEQQGWQNTVKTHLLLEQHEAYKMMIQQADLGKDGNAER